jgi:hypothetical protein
MANQPSPTVVADIAADQTAVTTAISAAARRALAEAAERRRAAKEAAPPTEIGGRSGPDPVRFGDWEKGGIAWDF